MTPFAPEVLAALTSAAKAVSLAPAALLALVSVETGGVAFAPSGLPQILCEPAIFYRQLPAEKRPQALKMGLAAKVWSREGYADQATASGRQARCERMIAYDETAAYRSISMGLGQIMGFNAINAGFPDAKAMYVAFADINVQARAIVAVLPALGVLEPLRNRNWVLVADRYNGPGERHNNYDAKIAAAYAHWEYALASGQLAAPAEGTLGLWSRGVAVESIQRGLIDAGIAVVPDGVFGPKTASAVAQFELLRGMPDTKGIVDQATADAILAAKDLPIPQGAREVATEQDLAPRSRIVQKAVALRNGAMTALGFGTAAVAKGATDAPAGGFDKMHATLTAALDNVDKVKALGERAEGVAPPGTMGKVLQLAAAYPLPVAGGGVIAAAATVALISHQISVARLDDHRSEPRHEPERFHSPRGGRRRGRHPGRPPARRPGRQGRDLPGRLPRRPAALARQPRQGATGLRGGVSRRGGKQGSRRRRPPRPE